MITNAPTWHLLQVSDVLDLELAQALASSLRVIAWEPQRTWFPWLTRVGGETQRAASTGDLTIRGLPVMHGYSRFPLSGIARTGSMTVARLVQQSTDQAHTPLICTIPYFAEVAERWSGPVVYWLTDLMAEYGGVDRAKVEQLDRRMCASASLVCPNSSRIAEYLVQHAGCDPKKIVVIPNATRATNLLPHPPQRPGDLPDALRGLKRPIAGVIGNLAGNMDWTLLEQMVARTPWLQWVFVGPTTMKIQDGVQARARESVMKHRRTHFVGRQPYGDLATYARGFDVAVLPYRRCEPTYSGSSTRFYEHLAACRPMIATRGFEELLHKRPLLELIDHASEAVETLEALRDQRFNDGYQSLRWKASRSGTWEVRAHSMQVALAERFPWMRDDLSYRDAEVASR